MYAICGVFVFFVLRALGELVLHLTSAGSFVSYAREFLGEKAVFAAGWMYFLDRAFTAVAEATAVAVYFHYRGAFNSGPQWLITFIVLSAVLVMNLIRSAGTIINVVVLTAALSSLNAGLHSTGRIRRSMARNGSAPKFMTRRSRHGVPTVGSC